ncbi:hypothetical protein NQ317_016919 [Molorchus minor]|uniref:RRM domain-containing protein n=1 Tax=Molorchus minor TaxID=1323400 RepID=A0ABQ9K305_9CUCU|nr:hypothetical protein NQ317_016919 [Molorchus minor]
MLEGWHDFRSFMGKHQGSEKKITRKVVDFIKIKEGKKIGHSEYSWPSSILNSHDENEYLFLDIYMKSKGFLYKQVRRTVGALVAVAQGKVSIKDIKFMLEIPSHQSWCKQIKTLPAHGLYLCEVEYSKEDRDTFRDFMVGSRVYVGGLPYGTTERDLERFFRGYGRMRDVLIKNGYGFVEFDDYRDADDAVYELNGKKLLGERVTVERARGTPRGRDQWSSSRNDHRSHERYGPPTRTNYRLIVENLSSRISWQDLKDYMRQAGEVTYADAHKQHRNEGVVEFASYSDMKNAIEKLDDTELNGRRIHLVEDKNTKRRRSGSYSSRSRSRSRSARRSRSRSRSRRSSHSKSKSRSRSRSGSAKADRDRGSKSKSRSRSRSNSRKKSVDRSRSNSRKKSVERSRSRSRSRTPDKRSKSREASKERSRSRSRSASKDRSKSRSRSRSAN